MDEVLENVDEGIKPGYSLRKRSTDSAHRDDSRDEVLKPSDEDGISADERFSEDDANGVEQGIEMEVTEDTESEETTGNEIMTEEDNIDQGEDMERNLLDPVDASNKGNPTKLFLLIEEHMFTGRKLISVETLTDVFGFDGKDRKARYYVKGIIHDKFGEKITFLTRSDNLKPQIAVADCAHSSGEILYKSNKDEIVREAAKILREEVDEFISTEKKDQVFPPTSFLTMEPTKKYCLS